MRKIFSMKPPIEPWMTHVEFVSKLLLRHFKQLLSITKNGSKVRIFDLFCFCSICSFLLCSL